MKMLLTKETKILPHLQMPVDLAERLLNYCSQSFKTLPQFKTDFFYIW